MHHFKYSFSVILMLPVALSGCLADKSGPASELFQTKSGHITITKAKVPDVTSESVGAMRFSSVALGVVEPSKVQGGDQTLPCGKAGFGGNGSVIAKGKLQQPGDTIQLTIANCSYRGVPIAGALEVNLVSREGQNYVANYSYKDFVFGNNADALTMNGEVTSDNSYDEQARRTVTARTTKNLELVQGAKSAKINEMWCADSYIGRKGEGPYEVDCTMILTSSAIDGWVALETSKKFQGKGGDNPTAGELLITGAIDTKTQIVAQPDGKHALIKWDSDGDGVYEGQLLKRWEDLESNMLSWVTKML